MTPITRRQFLATTTTAALAATPLVAVAESAATTPEPSRWIDIQLEPPPTGKPVAWFGPIPDNVSSCFINTSNGNIPVPSLASREPGKTYRVAVYLAPGTPTGYEARIEEVAC